MKKTTRIRTSITNERGERQINTQASEEVVRHVLKDGEIVGMVFLGTPQETVSTIINKVRMQFFLIILCMGVFVSIAAD
ncbi:MAG: cache domain-containing protein [Eubacterium sp.]|nr:cache domain-containing protein [Eubacterium sp.]